MYLSDDLAVGKVMALTIHFSHNRAIKQVAIDLGLEKRCGPPRDRYGRCCIVRDAYFQSPSVIHEGNGVIIIPPRASLIAGPRADPVYWT